MGPKGKRRWTPGFVLGVRRVKGPRRTPTGNQRERGNINSQGNVNAKGTRPSPSPGDPWSVTNQYEVVRLAQIHR